MRTFNIFALIQVSVFFFSGIVNYSSAQVTLNFESGNRAIEQGNCWNFSNLTYTNSANIILSGNWSGRSHQLNASSPEACWIKTPWMKVGSGNITFTTRFEGSNGSSRGLKIYYIPYSSSLAPIYEGTPELFYEYDWAQPFPNVTPQNFTVEIPAAIANSGNVYKIRVSMIGSGGSSRLISDNFIFPGVYWSDPANACGPMTLITDTDNDGVADSEDNYPTDPYRAYNNYFPSANTYGTLAFEDGWPSTGDYDMNDIVTDYLINTVTNAENQVVEVISKIVARASGASYQNAFGFQLDGIANNKIISVSGNHLGPDSFINTMPNGLESNQNFANCIVFDNFFTVMPHPGNGTGINTTIGAPFVPYDTLTVTMVFINNGIAASGGTVSINQLTPDIFNYYIIANQQRGTEIHLPDRIPTNLANTSLFGSGSDDTNPSQGKYYKTSSNLPWGININQGFSYPIEKSPVNDGYLYFIEWAVSSGLSRPDWYSNKPGYRDNSKIYTQ